MAVKINSKKIIKLEPNEYEAVARGQLYTLPNNLKLSVGDQILIKEHDGKLYTAREIIGQVTESNPGEFKFRKYAVTTSGSEHSQNKRDSRRVHKDGNNYNTYI